MLRIWLYTAILSTWISSLKLHPLMQNATQAVANRVSDGVVFTNRFKKVAKSVHTLSSEADKIRIPGNIGSYTQPIVELAKSASNIMKELEKIPSWRNLPWEAS